MKNRKVEVRLGRSLAVKDDDWKRVDIAVIGDVTDKEDYDEEADAAYDTAEKLVNSYLEKFTGLKVVEEDEERKARRESRDRRRNGSSE